MGAIGIKINFTWFGLLEGWDYLRIYASANPDPSFLLQTISGPGEFGDDGIFEVFTAATSVLIDLKTDYFGYTSDGFGAMVKMICMHTACVCVCVRCVCVCACV